MIVIVERYEPTAAPAGIASDRLRVCSYVPFPLPAWALSTLRDEFMAPVDVPAATPDPLPEAVDGGPMAVRLSRLAGIDRPLPGPA